MNARDAKRPVTRDEIIEVLQAHGISATPQRIEIATIMLEADHHLSADQVLLRLADIEAAVSKATVYNTLGLFAERGLVREVTVDTTKVFYDSNITEHHHFYNVDDGTLADFPADAAVIDQLPAAPAGTETDRVDIVIRVHNER
jgi:Fur family transcriptional regulator, iron response regulator